MESLVRPTKSLDLRFEPYNPVLQNYSSLTNLPSMILIHRRKVKRFDDFIRAH